MRPSVDDNRSSSGTLSAAPSLSNSKISLGASSHCSQKSTISQKSHVSAERPLTREEIIAAYLEKAKWYTSVCLGELRNDLLIGKLNDFFSRSTGTTAILSVFAFLFLIPFVVDPAISAITADFDPGLGIILTFNGICWFWNLFQSLSHVSWVIILIVKE